jgi:transglutaminase-like putative cysteine protease
VIDLPQRAAPAWGPAAALAAAAAVAVAAWWAPLGGAASRAAPLAAAAVVLSARRPSRSLGAAALAALLLAAPLIAGVSTAELLPTAWPALPARVFGGLQALASSHVAPVAPAPWSVAAALLLAGAAWIGAAALVARRSRLRVCAAIAAACAPWVCAALVDPASATPLHGAMLAFGGALWWSSTRVTAGSAVVVSLVLAAFSGVAAQTAGPRHPWLGLPWVARHLAPGFTTLEAVPTFGPLPDRRTGAPMLDITANQPALWRMQVLDVFDGSGWTFDAMPSRPLVQPAARPMSVAVRVRGLRNDLVVAPGRIDSVLTDGSTKPAVGEARRMLHPPRDGSTYRVWAQVVQADAAALKRAPNPTGAALTRYVTLGFPETPHSRVSDPFALLFGLPVFSRSLSVLSTRVPLFGVPADRPSMLVGTPYRDVALLAQRLAAPARTQWQVVARVMSYLRDRDRFRYTTQLSEPGRFPLVDFLLHDRAGDCQHFAGAAALLLRLAGVPARVVAGFATGVRANGRYHVRDLDAHDWIEVYFQGYGWVTFNPTPAVAAAAIPLQLDVLAPPQRKNGRGAATLLGALAVALAFASGLRWRRRRQPPLLGDLLVRLARGTGARVGAAGTLSELHSELERRIGPRTAALASEAERARFAPGPSGPPRRPRLRIAAALVADTGPWRAARTSVLALARRPAAND